jgi:hypothetical protein
MICTDPDFTGGNRTCHHTSLEGSMARETSNLSRTYRSVLSTPMLRRVWCISDAWEAGTDLSCFPCIKSTGGTYAAASVLGPHPAATSAGDICCQAGTPETDMICRAQ